MVDEAFEDSSELSRILVENDNLLCQQTMLHSVHFRICFACTGFWSSALPGIPAISLDLLLRGHLT